MAVPHEQPPAAPVVQVVGLGKRFGGVQALRGASLSLWSGEIHGFIYQEPSLFPDLSLAENVFVSRRRPREHHRHQY